MKSNKVLCLIYFLVGMLILSFLAALVLTIIE